MRMKGVVLQRDAVVGRRIARYWRSAGLDAVFVEDPNTVKQHLEGADLLGADEFDRDVVISALRERPELKACLWTVEPMFRLVRLLRQEPRISSVLGRPNFETTPRAWELLMLAHRLANPQKSAPFSAFLNWGFSGFEARIVNSSAMEAATAKVESFVSEIESPKWIAESINELTHELLMNALYDAPIDASGKPKYAHDRKAHIEVAPEEAPTLRVGSDGVLISVQVVDPFGRLQREHVLEGLQRGLQNAEVNASGGGAGLGMAACHNATVAMIYDLIPGKQTEVTGFFDLELNRREFRTCARSLHFFQRDVRSASEPQRKANTW
jgi:hypothetical protein